MTKLLHIHINQRGSALLIAMLILSVLTIIGLAVTRTSNIELQIVGNDRLQKKVFYEAESGAQIGWELIEQNLSCPNGFSTEPMNIWPSDPTDSTAPNLIVTDADFALQEKKSEVDIDGDEIFPEEDEDDDNESGPESLWERNKRHLPDQRDDDLMDDERDILYTGLKPPPDRDNIFTLVPYSLNEKDETPRTNIVAWGETRLTSGSAIQMAAGYEGKGKAAATGGGIIAYTIHSRHEHRQTNSESHIVIGYRHLIGQEGDCKY